MSSDWVDPHTPAGYLKQAQERYDKAWDAWWEVRTPASKERFELAETELEQAKRHHDANEKARREWQATLQAEKDAK